MTVDGVAVRRLFALNRGIDISPAELFDAVMKYQGLDGSWAETGWEDQCLWLDAFTTNEVSYAIH